MEKSIDKLEKQIDELNDKIINMSITIEKVITTLISMLPNQEFFKKNIGGKDGTG